MNLIKTIKNFIKVRTIATFVMLLMLSSITFAGASGFTALGSSLRDICSVAKGFLGIIAMLLIIMAASTYALGQLMGAETRARSVVWATAMFTGALIGILLFVILPPLLDAVLSGAAPGASSVTC